MRVYASATVVGTLCRRRGTVQKVLDFIISEFLHFALEAIAAFDGLGSHPVGGSRIVVYMGQSEVVGGDDE